jgi:hypothetical protein
MDKHFWIGVAVGATPMIAFGAFFLYSVVRDYRSGTLFR